MLLRDLRPRLDVAARDVQPRFVPAGYPRALKAAPKTTCPTRLVDIPVLVLRRQHKSSTQARVLLNDSRVPARKELAKKQEMFAGSKGSSEEIATM